MASFFIHSGRDHDALVRVEEQREQRAARGGAEGRGDVRAGAAASGSMRTAMTIITDIWRWVRETSTRFVRLYHARCGGEASAAKSAHARASSTDGHHHVMGCFG